jgi:hypothetical protein
MVKAGKSSAALVRCVDTKLFSNIAFEIDPLKGARKNLIAAPAENRLIHRTFDATEYST